MKLLTLNTHSLLESDYPQKLDRFAAYLLQERPDVIALQEVNQSKDADPARDLFGMTRLPGVGIPLKEDNHALSVVQKLRSGGIFCSWSYLPVKLGYAHYDEGLAILSLSGKIIQTDVCSVSRTDDYFNWRRRKVLGVRIAGRSDWFYCVHMGFWQDAEEPFAGQWKKLEEHVSERKMQHTVWLMGDFNAPAEIRGQSYDLIASSGWHDAHICAKSRYEGFTVPGRIDGWQQASVAMRIDHIWCSADVPVASCRTIFNGKDEAPVSDHFGVLMCTAQNS